ncbi:DUF2059 domain-containing protein [Zooshikella sp. RANM57]|uniref:DUF2059 domain-containing protein n=1 Tax=Zooshikella sp. RANM57 TaxID=3425863 RepID=UPI003D6DB061
MKFKNCIFFAILTSALLLHQNVLAENESYRKAADRLLTTMDLNRLLAATGENMLKMQLSQNPALQPFEKTMKAFFNKYISGESLREDYINIYMEAFTEKEINEINDFYSTPTGQKVLRETPALVSKGAALGQQRVQENIQELKNMIQEEAQRIRSLQQNAE